ALLCGLAPRPDNLPAHLGGVAHRAAHYRHAGARCLYRPHLLPATLDRARWTRVCRPFRILGKGDRRPCFSVLRRRSCAAPLVAARPPCSPCYGCLCRCRCSDLPCCARLNLRRSGPLPAADARVYALLRHRTVQSANEFSPGKVLSRSPLSYQPAALHRRTVRSLRRTLSHLQSTLADIRGASIRHLDPHGDPAADPGCDPPL